MPPALAYARLAARALKKGDPHSARLYAAQWQESQHPRDHGKFATKGGESGRGDSDRGGGAPRNYLAAALAAAGRGDSDHDDYAPDYGGESAYDSGYGGYGGYAPDGPAPYRPAYDPDADAALRAHAGPVLASLDAPERHAVRAYTGGSYEAINAPLRSGAPRGDWPEGAAAVVDALDGLLARTPPLARPRTVHRGLTLSGDAGEALAAQFEAAASSGAPVRFRSYLSTTSDPGEVGNFVGPSGGFVFEIEARRGLHLDPASRTGGESEFLLPRDQSFRVRSVERRTLGGDEVRVVKMEQLA